MDFLDQQAYATYFAPLYIESQGWASWRVNFKFIVHDLSQFVVHCKIRVGKCGIESLNTCVKNDPTSSALYVDPYSL